mgnify:CR=1 FL=1
MLGTRDTKAKARLTEAYCTIDFPSAHTAIRPKAWIISASALIYVLGGTAWDERRGRSIGELRRVDVRGN